MQRKVGAHSSAVEERVEGGDGNEPGLVCCQLDHRKLQFRQLAYPSHLEVLPKCSKLLFPRYRCGCWDFAAVSAADFSG
jgi:hypothetical protein